ncbi:hypothetical protein OEZ86_007104 [Tetradesmus obliquus]|nr:hypothetical protein OEZ86_007104 [Tetradesmus obliquus]
MLTPMISFSGQFGGQFGGQPSGADCSALCAAKAGSSGGVTSDGDCCCQLTGLLGGCWRASTFDCLTCVMSAYRCY